MSEITLVPDENLCLVIAPASKTIAPKYKRQKAIHVAKGDHDSVLIAFEMPRYVNGYDMSAEENSIQIHYANISCEDTTKHSEGFDGVEGITVAKNEETKEETLHFCWRVPANATKYAGALSIGVTFERYEKIDDEMREVYSWSTTPYGKIIVCNSMDSTEEAVESAYSYLIETCNRLLQNAIDSGMLDGLSAYEIAKKNGYKGTEAEWLENPYVTPEDFGAVGDGIEDDTGAIQKALAYHNVIFTKQYNIRTCEDKSLNDVSGHYGLGIQPLSNSNLIFCKGSKLIARKLTEDGKEYKPLRYAVINLFDVENVNIIGAEIQCNKYNGATMVEEETVRSQQGYAIQIFGGKNISIEGCNIYDALGDGILIRQSKEVSKEVSKNIKITNCEIHGNKRHGITILGCDGVTVDRCYIHDLKYKCKFETKDCDGNVITTEEGYNTLIQVGIDIESETGHNTALNNVVIKDTKIEGCKNASVTSHGGANETGIIIENCTIEGRVSAGSGEMHLTNTSLWTIISASGGEGDFPNHVYMDNCIVTGKTFLEIQRYTGEARKTCSVNKNITARNCVITGDGETSYSICSENETDATALFENCRFYNTNMRSSSSKYIFIGCSFDCQKNDKTAGYFMNGRYSFDNCTLTLNNSSGVPIQGTVDMTNSIVDSDQYKLFTGVPETYKGLVCNNIFKNSHELYVGSCDIKGNIFVKDTTIKKGGIKENNTYLDSSVVAELAENLGTERLTAEALLALDNVAKVLPKDEKGNFQNVAVAEDVIPKIYYDTIDDVNFMKESVGYSDGGTTKKMSAFIYDSKQKDGNATNAKSPCTGGLLFHNIINGNIVQCLYANDGQVYSRVYLASYENLGSWVNATEITINGLFTNIESLETKAENMEVVLSTLEKEVGNISAVLDELHTYAQALIGGEA